VKDIVEFIVDLFPDEILNLPPDPRKKPGSTTSAEAPTDRQALDA